MKFLNVVFTLIFLLFAYLQLNDPDPVLWVSIYGAVAIVLFLRVVGWYRRSVLIVVMVAIGAYSLMLSPDVYEWMMSSNKADLVGPMTDDKPYIEGSREFLGILIAEAALASQFLFRADGTILTLNHE